MLWITVLLAVGLSFGLLLFESLANFSRVRLERYCQAKNVDLLETIMEDESESILSLRIWNALLMLGLVVSLWITIGDRVPGEPANRIAQAAWFAGFWLGFMLLEVLILRPVGRWLAEPLLAKTWPVLELLILAATPWTALERRIVAFLFHLSGRSQAERSAAIQDELMNVVSEGEREGAIREDAADMIEGLIELPGTTVSTIMTPRSQMVMLQVAETIETAGRVISEQGFSRIPVFGKDRDEVIGILYAKDLLAYMGEPARELSAVPLRTPRYVAEDKPVDALLRELRQDRVHIAIVLDEYGGVAGLVTIEDILEEIVGEIEDEYDADDPPWIVRLDEHRIEIDARIPVSEFKTEFPLDIPDGADYDTMAGFIFHTLGYVPKSGDSFQHDKATFTILGANNRTIKRVRIALED